MASIREGNKGVLLIVDVQVDVVKGAWESERIVGNVAIAIERARAAGVPVIWVQHTDEDLVQGSPEWQWVPELVPASDVSSASDTTKSTAPLTPDHSHASHRKVLSSLSLDEFEFRSKLDLLCEEIRRSASMDDAEFRAAEHLADEPATPSSAHHVQLLVETTLPAMEAPRIHQELLPPVSPAAPVTATSIAPGVATTSHRKKRVSWGSLEVRKYPIIPGQHPDCVVGPPVRFPLLPFLYFLSFPAILFSRRGAPVVP